ncbi:hypothetical protein PVA45_08390 (plasmid) [Entomospira entomophila]|uniref:Uncharacterized protein n=1 Tax=Entomospira entomophila TaxID=2719988 RepID=A0A968GAC0_9SPIO|nr:hypothetical protein [Entomospira entomophilus]NIZ41523.1 hypothetical protein [Entomospira entomophilus]WDI36449.1 hypothetical protein PVA45_08390 [Entomospira entomophilus]
MNPDYTQRLQAIGRSVPEESFNINHGSSYEMDIDNLPRGNREAVLALSNFHLVAKEVRAQMEMKFFQKYDNPNFSLLRMCSLRNFFIFNMRDVVAGNLLYSTSIRSLEDLYAAMGDELKIKKAEVNGMMDATMLALMHVYVDIFRFASLHFLSTPVIDEHGKVTVRQDNIVSYILGIIEKTVTFYPLSQKRTLLVPEHMEFAFKSYGVSNELNTSWFDAFCTFLRNSNISLIFVPVPLELNAILFPVSLELKVILLVCDNLIEKVSGLAPSFSQEIFDNVKENLLRQYHFGTDVYQLVNTGLHIDYPIASFRIDI